MPVRPAVAPIAVRVAARAARRMAVRLAVLATAMALTGVASVVAAETAAAAVPTPPVPAGLPAAIEGYWTPYVPQVSCDPVDKPGVQAFARLLTTTYPDTSSWGISRPCNAWNDTSEHHDGRALDWKVSSFVPAQAAEANAVLSWLLAPDAAGNQAALARRLGIMYIIWNKRIFGTYDIAGGWQPYSCSGNVTDCHQDHVHFSFTWAGARGVTSFWTKQVAANDYGPCRVAGLSWAPPYTAPNPRPCPDVTTTWPPLPAGAPAWLPAVRTWSGVRVGYGSSGPAVTAVQQALNVTPVSGWFGSITLGALDSFQASHGLAVTGVTDVPTWQALLDTTTAPVVPPRAATFAAPAPVGTDVYTRALDRSVQRASFTAGRVGDTAEALGGLTDSAPAVGGPAGAAVLAVRGLDNHLWVRTGQPGAWSGWSMVGGLTRYGPAVASDPAGGVSVFVTGLDNALWVNRLVGGGWSGWTSLGGYLLSGPAAVAGPGRLDVAGVGGDSAVWLRSQSAAGWAPWGSQGGLSRSAPALAFDPTTGRELLAVRGLDDGAWTRTPGGGGWTSLGGITYDAPGATASAPGALVLAVRGANNQVWSRTLTSSWAGWVAG